MNFLALFCVSHKTGSLFESFITKLEKENPTHNFDINLFLDRHSCRASILILKFFKISIEKSELTLIDLSDDDKQLISQEVI